MLRDLNNSSVAIIDRLEMEFTPGLNLLTGETGAGKSIIIDALGLALGARGSADLVKTGAREAAVEAVFDNPDSERLRRLADEAGFSLGDELILRRRVSAKGVSRAYVNGSHAGVATLRSLGELLVNVHGQRDGDALLGAVGQMAVLDAYAGAGEVAERVSETYDRLRSVEDELESTVTDERARARELDLLEHQVSEIESAKLEPGEEEHLGRESELLRNAERLRELSDGAFRQLYAGDDAITARLAGLVAVVSELAGFDKSFAADGKQLEEARYQLEEIANSLRDFCARIDDDPRRLEKIEERLDAIRTLQRKYGETTAEVLGYLEKAKARRAELQGADERLEILRAELSELERDYERAAAELRSARESAIPEFAAKVRSHLAELAMEKAEFEVSLRDNPRGRTRRGTDRVAFLISPNPGEDLKPLEKVASGGELSRLMLAIKSSSAEPKGYRTVIFDEVDAGIGGRVAEFVGRKLKRLSASQQVICITHLPQIAVYAEHHSRVVKRSGAGVTEVESRALGEDERVEELARMLGGEKITEVTRRHALQLLKQARSHS